MVEIRRYLETGLREYILRTLEACLHSICNTGNLREDTFWSVYFLL